MTTPDKNTPHLQGEANCGLQIQSVEYNWARMVQESRYPKVTNLNRYWRDYAALGGLSGLVIAVDQWTKWLVRTNLPFQATWLPDWLQWLTPYARIVHWSNSGAAFGTFQNGNSVFTVLAIIVIAAILYYYPRVDPGDWTLRLAMGLQLGGAAGNLIDRLILRRVTDFIAVGNFPVFNVADASISIGVVVLLLGVWAKERAEKRALVAKE